jgi:hypothetical protein
MVSCLSSPSLRAIVSEVREASKYIDWAKLKYSPHLSARLLFFRRLEKSVDCRFRLDRLVDILRRISFETLAFSSIRVCTDDIHVSDSLPMLAAHIVSV